MTADCLHQGSRQTLLLLVYYTQPEVDFVCLFKVWRHAHDLRKGFLGVIQGAISVVENADSIPEFGFLPGLELSSKASEHSPLDLEVVEGLLICSVGLGEIVRHQVAVAYRESAFAWAGKVRSHTQGLPHLAITVFEFCNGFKVFNGLRVGILASENIRDAQQSRYGKGDSVAERVRRNL